MNSHCQNFSIRGLQYNVRRWGPADAEPLLLLHGSRDASITFQFMVEELKRDWSIFAPDWRGHGLSEHHHHGTYWFHDFVADLDFLTEALFAGDTVPIIGHSLGGNIAGIFAGLRPEKVSHIVSINGFGPLVDHLPVNSQQLLNRYLDKLHSKRQHAVYPSLGDMANRLRQANPLLTAERASFLVEHLSKGNKDVGFTWLYDPVHRFTLPTLHSLEDWGAIWHHIRSPVCWIASRDSRPEAPVNHPKILQARAALVPGLHYEQVDDLGHNVHHQIPDTIATIAESFIASDSGPRANVES